MKKFGLIICGLLASGEASASEIKPTLSIEQGQMLINLMNQEIKDSCLRGNCWASAKPLGPIIEEIVRAASQPQVTPQVPVPVPVPEAVGPPKSSLFPEDGAKPSVKPEGDSDGKNN